MSLLKSLFQNNENENTSSSVSIVEKYSDLIKTISDISVVASRLSRFNELFVFIYGDYSSNTLSFQLKADLGREFEELQEWRQKYDSNMACSIFKFTPESLYVFIYNVEIVEDEFGHIAKCEKIFTGINKSENIELHKILCDNLSKIENVKMSTQSDTKKYTICLRESD